MKRSLVCFLTLLFVVAFASALIACNVKAETYTVLYSTNGGTGTTPKSQKYREGETFALADADGFVRDGFIFVGWDDGVDIFAPGETYVMPNKNVTLKAVWENVDEEAVKYTVTYDANGGTGTPPAVIKREADETFLLASSSTFIRDGYEFVGWNDGEMTFPSSVEYTMPEHDVTFTAQWEAVVTEFGLEYVANGGDGTAPELRKITVGVRFTLAAADTFNREGYSFKGWNDGNATYQAGAQYIMPDHDVTFTAQWADKDGQAVGFTVTYNLYGGDGTTPTIASYEVGTKFALAVGNFTRDGRNLIGWSDGEKTYRVGVLYTMPDHDVTFTAVYEDEYDQAD